MNSIDQMVEVIGCLRVRLDEDDDYLRMVIRTVERVLGRLSPGTLTLPYRFQGEKRFIAIRKSVQQPRWHLAWGDETGDLVPLLSAPRGARAEVFSLTQWPSRCDTSPIEVLIEAVVDEMRKIVQGREGQMPIARRVMRAMDKVT